MSAPLKTSSGQQGSGPLPLVEQFKHGLDSPICLTWEWTYACNLSCAHCLSSSGRRDPAELSTDEIKAVLDELERTIGHHLDEEETTILEATRKQVPAAQRAELGGRFLQLREDALDSDCGSLARVRKLARALEAGRAGGPFRS